MADGQPGRPSDYSEEVAETILLGILDGESLRQICTKPGMPHRSTVLRWLDARSDFAAKYARAREMQADVMDDKILDAAEACNADNAAAARVKISAYQWRAAKLAPKKYGDTTNLKHSGAIGTFDPTKCSDEQLEQLAGILGPIAAGGGDAPAGEGGAGEAED
jgi:hypothetical protein